ncbi:S-layer homology domain-containing protein [Alkaliphilus sp. MSJ-5]|uniref:S-layer homology domain-containing protein n=1 Tax=Alkaliphilus flagellatus TaxID=2841507 RepID=A0ABS6G3T4_9FIRM|nr:S-layer homology domain-containing protein [Alkaliphilus flagellatus]MBU5676834.1 S-layer homology domain-containing protein [Alkaliphilus flagellatus]
MKRKSIAIFTVLFMFFSISNTVFASDIKDIDNHWAKDNITYLIDKDIIGGYPDGNFRPDATITRAEFTKILINALHDDPGIAPYAHWAGLYVERAIEEGYVIRTEYGGGYDLNITRGEMARIISRALEEEPVSIEELKNQITDFSQIPTSYQEHVAKVYAAGIITGYTDGTFKYENTATRAEASTMLLRFLDLSKRQIPEVKEIVEEEPVKEEEKNYKDMTELPSKSFDSLNLGGSVKTEGIPTDGNSKIEKVYYGTVKDFPIRVGNFIITGIKKDTKPDIYNFYNVYLQGYALTDDSLSSLRTGYIDNQNQYRYRGLMGFDQKMHDYMVKIYPDIVGLGSMAVKAYTPFTTKFEIESSYDWEFDKNNYSFKLNQAEQIIIQDKRNQDKGIVFIKNPFK